MREVRSIQMMEELIPLVQELEAIQERTIQVTKVRADAFASG